jgi:uncharacterized protein (DUF885 family)
VSVPEHTAGDHPVFDLSDAFVDRFAEVAPLHATFVGVRGHDDRWGDLGPAGIDELAEVLRDTRQQLAALPTAEDAGSRLAVRVLHEFLEEELDAIEHEDPLRDVSHLTATPLLMREALEVQAVGSGEEREAFVARLESLPAALTDWCRRMEVALDRGVLAARRQATSVIEQLHDMASEDGAYRRRVAAFAKQAPEHADAAIASLPAMRRAAKETARFLERTYLPVAPTRDAVGAQRYDREVRRHLGEPLDAADAYAWAWQQLADLSARASGVAERIDRDRDLVGVFQRLRTDPAYAAPDPETFRQLMQRRQALALEQLAGTHFDVPEGIRHVEVRLSPPGSPLGASYIGPSEDLSRPGSIWWSLGDRRRIPLFEEVSTAYHEGFPGHHLQVGLQVTLTDRLSRTHRLLTGTTGYVEGWALYAETLMDELGHLEQPEYELGYLTSSLLRVVRVLVDLGLHLEWSIPEDAPFRPGEPWTFDLAVEALETLAGLDHDYAVSEVTRYLGWPGQAVSYALGQRAILELREQRRARDGRTFDLRAFHADVLGSGAVGLGHLRELVLASGPAEGAAGAAGGRSGA